MTYAELRSVLASLGYARDDAGEGRVVYRNPGRHLMIILSTMPEGAVIRPIDRLRVKMTLANDGVVPEEEFDDLFRGRGGIRVQAGKGSAGAIKKARAVKARPKAPKRPAGVAPSKGKAGGEE